MISGRHRTIGGIVGCVMLVVAVACTPAVSGPAVPRPAEATGTAVPETSRTPSSARPEKSSLKFGLSVGGPRNLPIYLAADRTFRDEGLTVEVVSFNGDTEVTQALAADSVDVAAPSVNSVLNVIGAGQPITGFYSGLNQADFEWLARPEIKGWADLKGKSVGIGSFGGLTDFLTRHILRKHGLDATGDVQMVQVGGSSTAFQALKAGRIDVAVLAPPFKWQAADEGFTRLGAQATEVAEAWPRNVLAAKERFLDEHPNTIRALLRAHVKAIRLARADRDGAVQTIMQALKYERLPAERAYDDIINGFDERGGLPATAMPLFWDIAVAAGEVTEPWPESRFLDRRFVDSFDEWAPK